MEASEHRYIHGAEDELEEATSPEALKFLSWFFAMDGLGSKVIGWLFSDTEKVIQFREWVFADDDLTWSLIQHACEDLGWPIADEDRHHDRYKGFWQWKFAKYLSDTDQSKQLAKWFSKKIIPDLVAFGESIERTRTKHTGVRTDSTPRDTSAAGDVEFGWVLHKQIQLDNATRSGARRGAVGMDNTTIITRMKDACTFPVRDEQITIEVRDPDGVVVADPEDRTPDNVIYVAIDIADIKLITPLAGLIGTIHMHSSAEFLIE